MTPVALTLDDVTLLKADYYTYDDVHVVEIWSRDDVNDDFELQLEGERGKWRRTPNNLTVRLSQQGMLNRRKNIMPLVRASK